MKNLRIVSIIILLFTASCSVKSNDLSVTIDEVLQESLHSANNQKKYYAYYLPAGIGRLSATPTGNTFNLDGQTFLMNLNVAKIVQEDSTHLTQSVFDVRKASETYSGEYLDGSGQTIAYQMEIYPSNGQYVVYLQTDTLEFCAYAHEANISYLAETMMRIARNTIVYYDEVIADFRLQNQITYQTKKVELFENLIPENGTIDELLIESGEKNVSEENEK